MVITDIRNKYFEMRGEEKRGKNTKKGNTYKVMTGGNSNLAWHTILGDSANLNTVKKGEFNEKYEKNNVDQFYDKIKNAVSSSKAVTISFDKKAHTRKSKNNSGTGQVGNSGEHIDRGLVFNHAYTVVDCTEESGIKYIWLINPWSSRKGVEYDKNTGKRNEKIKGYSINEQNKDGRFKLKARTAFRYLYDFDILNFYL